MPRLILIASLWTLARHPRPNAEWSLARKIDAIARAGFDGIMGRLTAEHRPLIEKHGLQHRIGLLVAHDPDEFEAQIRERKEGGAQHLNVHLARHDTPPREAVKLWLRFERAAEKVGGLEASLETHRDHCTETPEKTEEFVARYHALTGRLPRLTFDFSHWAIVKHLWPANYRERLLANPELLARSRQMHFRPFNGHHCQVALTHRGGITPEGESYLRFVREVLTAWRAANPERDTPLFACPEFGPGLDDGGGYHITGLPPPWPEALRMREELVRLWKSRGRSAEKRGA